MTGHIPIELPTKPYIRAYLLSNLGEKPVMNATHKIGRSFFSILQHSLNKDRTNFFPSAYKANITVYVTIDDFNHRGACVNASNIRYFNLFLEQEVKERFYFLMDTYVELLPSFEAHLPTVRKRLNIDIEDWADDSMKKDYYRYRKRNNLPLLYNKTFGELVPSDSAENEPF